MRRILFPLAALIVASLACGPTSTPEPDVSSTLPPTPPPVEDSNTAGSQQNGERPSELSSDQIDRITLASVQIIAARNVGGGVDPLWTGSGTIVTPTGEIVTNCHVACGAPVLIVALTNSADEPPEPLYTAEIQHFDEDVDLAILQITTDINGNAVSPTDLPFLEIGDSNSLRLGDPIRIFGYPGVGGTTITFTAGSVSGFESAVVNGASERVIIKTDADIAGGNSGGTAVDLFGNLVGIPTWVNPDVREGVTIGGIGVLRPVNLVSVVRGSSSGSPPALDEAALPPSSDPDSFEPNDDYDSAVGPLASGESISAYISWEDDLDVFYLTTQTTQPISIQLTNIPSGTDYDLYLLDEEDVLTFSESETPQEFIEYVPTAAGTYWIVVASYAGSSTSSAYNLSVSYDGGGSAGGVQPSGSTVRVFGQTLDGNTGNPLVGGVFGVLTSGTNCGVFFGAPELDLTKVVASAETDGKGLFSLSGVPTGATYNAFFVYGNDYVCENNWLEVPTNSGDVDLGEITITFD